MADIQFRTLIFKAHAALITTGCHSREKWWHNRNNPVALISIFLHMRRFLKTPFPGGCFNTSHLFSEGPSTWKSAENKKFGSATDIPSGSTWAGVITKPHFIDDKTEVWKSQVTAFLVSQVALREWPPWVPLSLDVKNACKELFIYTKAIDSRSGPVNDWPVFRPWSSWELRVTPGQTEATSSSS